MTYCRELGDRPARQHGPANHRRAQPSVPRQHLDGRERRRGVEAAVIVADEDDCHLAEEPAEHDDDDREAIATRPSRCRRDLV